MESRRNRDHRHWRRGHSAAISRCRPEGFAVAQFWIDTRDTRNISRASKFCHKFVVRIDHAQTRGRLQAQIAQRPVARAVADAPIGRTDDVPLRVELSRTTWVLDLFLASQLLNGYDPDTNRRLGFAYQIADFVHEDQFLAVGREFPIGENPSLWATLEFTRLIKAGRRSILRLRLWPALRPPRDATISRRDRARGRW